MEKENEKTAEVQAINELTDLDIQNLMYLMLVRLGGIVKVSRDNLDAMLGANQNNPMKIDISYDDSKKMYYFSTAIRRKSTKKVSKLYVPNNSILTPN